MDRSSVCRSRWRYRRRLKIWWTHGMTTLPPRIRPRPTFPQPPIAAGHSRLPPGFCQLVLRVYMFPVTFRARWVPYLHSAG
jgi:hypothetical protein